MLGFTKRTDYALIALCYLAGQKEGRWVTSREIAEEYDVPPELLAKVLQRLGRKGIVNSHPGPSGGYSLGRDLGRISVAEVMMAIEGPLKVVSCLREREGGLPCVVLERCIVKDPILGIQRRLFDLLNSIAVAELSQPTLGASYEAAHLYG